MNRTLVFATALAAGLATTNLFAQAPAAPAAAPAAAAVAPQAIPAKVAIIAFEQVVVATNEGQRAVAEVQKKYEPKKSQIETQGAEVDSLKKQLQALPASASDEQRASLIKSIDVKDKALQRDAEDAQNSYQSDLQEAFGKVEQKVGQTAVKYAQDNGFTLLLNRSGNPQVPDPILWFAQTTDISQAVVNAYNTSSGVAAPAPSAPSAVHHTTPSAAPKK
ncbi:OmpH family outer membrane protein [Granulicella mallensis]|uniref:Outer membrane chaperone Skp (OmpH) n=1 Tax=Granulicella mallensis (strain ATCC BAA-1857 / DSM 23137 / MP5ACTX8) TaxID=682795 RepID=G8P1J3_GRAMM|nr:OmpH family outer membrane protein [Granulicella mallensis]AEU34732.1 outer membrane chaperone Skp (OmpH) [Granulicella mallensis MP5ACTX8]